MITILDSIINIIRKERRRPISPFMSTRIFTLMKIKILKRAAPKITRSKWLSTHPSSWTNRMCHVLGEVGWWAKVTIAQGGR
jgi:hypothetical protein